MGYSDEAGAPDAVGDEIVKDTMGAAHMEEFRAPGIDVLGGGEGDVNEVDANGDLVADEFDAPEPEALSRDAFFDVFSIGFSAPGMVMPEFAQVAIQQGEAETARAASDAVYRLLEIYYPRALMPAGETVALLIAAGPFFIAKAMVVRAILAARGAPEPVEAGQGAEFTSRRAARAGNQPQAASDGAAPPAGSHLDWMGEEAA